MEQKGTGSRLFGSRTRMVMLALGAGFAALIIRLFYLQVVQADMWREKASSQQMYSTSISANRGNIFDRNMKTLAKSVTVWTVFISPAEMEENQRELVTFVQNFKALYPKKTVWCYSGYTWEQLTGKVPCPARCEVTDELLRLLDVLVDGRFVEAEHDISLRFRGSRNQRLLDVPKSLAAGQPVWWQDEKVFSTHTME